MGKLLLAALLAVPGIARAQFVHVDNPPASGESNTYTSSKTYTSTVAIAPPGNSYSGSLIVESTSASNADAIQTWVRNDGYEHARFTQNGFLVWGAQNIAAPAHFINITTGAANSGAINIDMDGTSPQIIWMAYRANSAGSAMTFRHARGTRASPSILSLGDNLGTINWSALTTGSTFAGGAIITAVVSSGTWDSAQRPTSLTFATGSIGTTAQNERMRLSDSGGFGIGNTDPQGMVHISSRPYTGNKATYLALPSVYIDGDSPCPLQIGGTPCGAGSSATFNSSGQLTLAGANANFVNGSSITTSGGLFGSSLMFGSNGVKQSSATVIHACGNTSVATLATGTTFFAFSPDSAITLLRLTSTIAVAGVGGSGDVFKCNAAGASGPTVTSAAAAAAGTTTVGASNATNVGYQTTVFCHEDSEATTRPIGEICLEYVMQ